VTKFSVDNIFPIVANLVPAIIVAVIASWVTVQLSLRQFYTEKWWERKADAYAKVIGSLVALNYSLGQLWRAETDEQEVLLRKDQETIWQEYREALTQLEQAATTGNFILSAKATAALSDLIRKLQTESEESNLRGGDTVGFVSECSGAATHCLEALRGEAKADLHVK
jgi:hypothetical protein